MVATMARNIGKFFLIYGAWIVSAALALLDFVLVRQAIMTLVVRFVGKWGRAAAVNFSMVIIGLAWLIAIIFLEAYYREGYSAGLLPRRFGKVTLYMLGIAAVAALIIQFVV